MLVTVRSTVRWTAQKWWTSTAVVESIILWQCKMNSLAANLFILLSLPVHAERSIHLLLQNKQSYSLLHYLHGTFSPIANYSNGFRPIAVTPAAWLAHLSHEQLPTPQWEVQTRGELMDFLTVVVTGCPDCRCYRVKLGYNVASKVTWRIFSVLLMTTEQVRWACFQKYQDFSTKETGQRAEVRLQWSKLEHVED